MKRHANCLDTNFRRSDYPWKRAPAQDCILYNITVCSVGIISMTNIKAANELGNLSRDDDAKWTRTRILKPHWTLTVGNLGATRLTPIDGNPKAAKSTGTCIISALPSIVCATVRRNYSHLLWVWDRIPLVWEETRLSPRLVGVCGQRREHAGMAKLY